MSENNSLSCHEVARQYGFLLRGDLYNGPDSFYVHYKHPTRELILRVPRSKPTTAVMLDYEGRTCSTPAALRQFLEDIGIRPACGHSM
jgi:hypothetical protein